MKRLENQGLLPAKLREAASMDEYDLFDVMVMMVYRVETLARSERTARFEDDQPEWFFHAAAPGEQGAPRRRRAV